MSNLFSGIPVLSDEKEPFHISIWPTLAKKVFRVSFAAKNCQMFQNSKHIKMRFSSNINIPKVMATPENYLKSLENRLLQIDENLEISKSLCDTLLPQKYREEFKNYLDISKFKTSPLDWKINE